MSVSKIRAVAGLVFLLSLSFAIGAHGSDQGSDSDLTEAVDDQAALLARLAEDFGVPLVDLQFLYDSGYKAGELWLALEVAKISGKSLTEVVALTAGMQGHGWGQVAKVFGIKPGSPAFLELKGKAIENRKRSEKVAVEAKGTARTGGDKPGKPAETGKKK